VNIVETRDTLSTLGILRIVQDGKQVRLDAEVLSNTACCPTCRTPSPKVHDRYRRRPMDLPWRNRTVRMRVMVRRFRCVNPHCRRYTFAEDCGANLRRRAQRTVEANETLLEIARVGGGEAGTRTAKRIGMPVSPDTLLRLIRRNPAPTRSTPRVLGVDDLALRKRCRYATILVDMETHRPVDLLEDRESETLAAWLKDHSGVEVVVRDRSGAYADGARQGARQARQVADRFHLVQNASTALDELLRTRRRLAEALSQPASISGEAGREETGDATPSPPDRLGLGARTEIRKARRAARVAKWQEIHALRAAGRNISEIARELGVGRPSVRLYLSTPEPPKTGRLHPRPSGLASPLLAPFSDYLQDRWQEGCHNGRELFREISSRGYTGGQSLLFQAIKAWRPPRPTKQQKRLSKRTTVRWICLRPPDQLKSEEKLVLEQVLAHDQELARGHDLVQRFRRLVATRDLGSLDQWLTDAQESELAPFKALANGIMSDRAAVEAALTTEWSKSRVPYCTSLIVSFTFTLVAVISEPICAAPARRDGRRAARLCHCTSMPVVGPRDTNDAASAV
jgi:transposase